MLSQKSIEFINMTAREHGASRVLLFGSCLSQNESEAHDIDLAVEGLNNISFNLMWDDLMWAEELGTKAVDLIRIEDAHWLNPIILDEGAVIYETEPSRVAV